MIQFEKNCGVDGGNICVIDMDQHDIKEEDINWCGHKVKVPPGEYDVNVQIPNTWRGAVNKKAKFKTGGNVYIGDAGYVCRESNPLCENVPEAKSAQVV